MQHMHSATQCQAFLVMFFKCSHIFGVNLNNKEKKNSLVSFEMQRIVSIKREIIDF